MAENVQAEVIGASWSIGGGPSIGTASGRLFSFLDPNPDEVDLGDIAHGLSDICRFGGHTREFYSVAQHSVLVSRLCDTADARWGLLHDASEAYLGDVVSPIKRLPGMATYRTSEEVLMIAVELRFGLPWPEPSSVKLGDRLAAWLEQRDLMHVEPMKFGYVVERPDLSVLGIEIDPLGPREARKLFLDRAAELSIR